MLNPDPYAPPQPSLLPDGMNMQGFTNALRKKSMPDLRHQQQHPLYSNLEYQQYPKSASSGSSRYGGQPNSISPPMSSTASSSSHSNITPRHSTHDLRSVAASASNRRSMYMHTAAPGENNSIPPVPALPANLLHNGTGSLPSNAMVGNAAMAPGPASATANGSISSGPDRHSLIFGSGSVDFDNGSSSIGSSAVPRSGASLPTSTLSLDSKIVGSPVKGDANGGVVRQPKGPDNASSWTRANAIIPGSSL